MFSRLKVFADVLASMLRPDERALALQTATYLGGEEDLGQPPPKFGLDTVVDMAFGWPSDYFWSMTDRWVSGTSLIGWPGCEAQQLAKVIEMHDLLVTDQRLLVVDISDSKDPRIVWSREREHIASIRRAPRFGQAGRIWVLMADGSAVSLMLGVISAAGAKRVIEAWGSTQLPEGGPSPRS